ncbi:MAG TPA: chemotaxis protein CheW [Gemmatimonadaceae bacterium]|nr:chemotaxis protein CheW [Gemmatimonadaceae bacterium]
MTERTDCWNVIGVAGDRSCAELSAHTHCRNCPTYAAAAATRLDRPIADDAIEIATAYYAAPREVEDAATASCFVFRLGSEWLALPMALLDEVVSARPTHSLPHRRGAVKIGVLSVRGDILVHVSLAGLLVIPDDGTTPAGANGHGRSAPRVVVLADGRGRLAISVDEVMGIHRYDPIVLRPVPATLGQSMISYASALLAVGDRIVGVLDGGRVLASLSHALS